MAGVGNPGSPPFAIGVLRVEPGTGDEERREARLQVALRAHGFGYFLLDVVEVAGGQADPGYEVLEQLAVRTAAEAFVVQGEVDLAWLRPAADRLRMIIRLPAPRSG